MTIMTSNNTLTIIPWIEVHITSRTLDTHGYVRAWCTNEDKNHPMVTAGGYVLEHRLIMARHLGRCLHDYEQIHHKNQVKHDNRIENLELLSSSEHNRIHHPSIESSIGIENIRCSQCGSSETLTQIINGRATRRWFRIRINKNDDDAHDQKVIVCNRCMSKHYWPQYYLKNGDRVREHSRYQRRLYYYKNKDRILRSVRAYYQTHRELIIIKLRQRRARSALQTSEVYEPDIAHGTNCKCCTKTQLDSYRKYNTNTNNSGNPFREKNRSRRRTKYKSYKPTTVQKDRSWLLEVLG